MDKITFEAGYGETGKIWLNTLEPCAVCKQSAVCLNIDSSDGEYGSGAVCKPCIDKLFKQFESRGEPNEKA